MLYEQESLEKIVGRARSFGSFLMPWNFPKAPPTVEDDINCLKARELVIDGYHVIVHYSKANYDTHCLETMQVFGKTSPFLPFQLVCKLAKAYLGEHELSLVELFRENRKIYCWSLSVDLDGKAIPSPFEAKVEHCQFEGLHYVYMQPNQVNFY